LALLLDKALRQSLYPLLENDVVTGAAVEDILALIPDENVVAGASFPEQASPHQDSPPKGA